MVSVYLLMVGLLVCADANTPATITNYVQIPNGTVVPGTKITFICETEEASTADLFINNTHLDDNAQIHTFNGFNYSYSLIERGVWNNTVTTIATPENNDTEVVCHVTGSIGGQRDTRELIITVANVPLAPQPSAQILFGGNIMMISWDEPFSHGLPILNYSLTVSNQSGQIISEVLSGDTWGHNISKSSSETSTTCDALSITLTASTIVGQSDEGSVTGGFPIFPATEGVMMGHNVIFNRNIIWIIITFQAPAVCTYQEPADYYLGLHLSGREVASLGPNRASAHTIMENFTCGILIDEVYLATLTISHHLLPGEQSINISIVTQLLSTTTVLSPTTVPSYSTVQPGSTAPSTTMESTAPSSTVESSSTMGSSSTMESTAPTSTMGSLSTMGSTVSPITEQLLIIIIVSILAVCILLAVLILSVSCVCACRKKRRRPAIGEHTDISLSMPATPEFQLAPPPKGRKQVPTSLTPMSVNPIYDGVTYDSPGGESFKALLGNGSVPSTPLQGPCTPMVPTTPLGEANTRYFDLPPGLPPPRRVSVGMRPSQLPPGIPEEEVESTPTQKDAYGEMLRQRSASCMVSRPPNVPPAVYEAMGGDYEVLRN